MEKDLKKPEQLSDKEIKSAISYSRKRLNAAKLVDTKVNHFIYGLALSAEQENRRKAELTKELLQK